MSATEIADTFSLTISSKFNYSDVAGLVLALRDRLGLQHFVETGAFLGATARWASQHFPLVTTIEINPTFHGMAASKMPANVQCLLGDSRVLLPQIIAGLTGPALFYLDAHNVNGLFGSRPDDCPVLDELEAILPLPSCAVLIDDADTFTGKNGGWPSVLQIAALVARHGQTGGVSRNMVALVPQEAADLLQDFVVPDDSRRIPVSDTPQQQPQETPAGAGFGELNVDDSKIDIIRHPDNAHLDQPREPEQPPA